MFCKQCGNQIPDGANVCPQCGTVQTQNNHPAGGSKPSGNANTATISLVCGISSIVVAVLGGIMFGVVAGIIAVVLGAVAVITGITAKKESGNTKGTGGFVCGLLGLIFGVIFAAGCGICGCADPTGYTCYGCVGGSCKAKSDLGNALGSYEDLLNDLDW